MPRHGALFRVLFRVLCCAVSCRVLSCVVAFCYVMLGSHWPKHALLSHAPQGRTLAHLLEETIPEFPTAVKKVIPLFVLSCPGAIIKWNWPINVSSWRAGGVLSLFLVLVQAYV